ncbi:MAG: hypothetical protein NWE89_08100 [Candidatus Bathyarchaeota archaeon]|nr:hypothetical protein [Candidatus Bathyarchaeota archaeon]
MSEPPSAYTINHEGLRMDVALVETDMLLIHEETIPIRLMSLEHSIRRDGVQSAPIIVDRDSMVVLDGMHRTAVMKRMGCRFTCVCLLDYFDPRINVQRWCRVIPPAFDPEKAKNILSSFDLRLESMPQLKNLDDEAGLMLIYKDRAFKVNTSNNDLGQAFKRSYELENLLRSRSYKIIHGTETEALAHIRSGVYEAALCLPKVTKDQVIEVATNNMILTPKATRHKLPARPVQVNVPLSLLMDKKLTLEEANKTLADTLNEPKRYNLGTKWMGRVYNEVLYVFHDDS